MLMELQGYHFNIGVTYHITKGGVVYSHIYVVGTSKHKLLALSYFLVATIILFSRYISNHIMKSIQGN